MSQVVTLPINGAAEQQYHHASVNYTWNAEDRSLNISLLTLPKKDTTTPPPYLEVRITFRKIIPGITVEKVTQVVRSSEPNYTFTKLLTEKALFTESVIVGSHIDILETEVFAYELPNSLHPMFSLGKHESVKDLSLAAHCILEGARILTPDGWLPIEKLMPGDSVLSHTGQKKTIIKRAVWNLKYESSPICNDGRVFRVEKGYAGNKETVYLSYHHKLLTYYKKFVKAGHARLPEATKEEVTKDGFYRLYNIQVEDHKKNHLLVGGGLVIESWDGITDSAVKTKVVNPTK